MRQNVTLYDTLGVERDATDKAIRAAFRKLALKHHPDRFSGKDRDAAEKNFQGMTEAFNVLSHPDSREEYDKEISQGTDVKAMAPKEIARRLDPAGDLVRDQLVLLDDHLVPESRIAHQPPPWNSVSVTIIHSSTMGHKRSSGTEPSAHWN